MGAKRHAQDEKQPEDNQKTVAPMKLVVRGLAITGKTSIVVDPENTIADMKIKIHNKTGLDPGRTRLVHKDKLMQPDGSKVSDYPVVDGDVIQIFGNFSSFLGRQGWVFTRTSGERLS